MRARRGDNAASRSHGSEHLEIELVVGFIVMAYHAAANEADFDGGWQYVGHTTLQSAYLAGANADIVLEDGRDLNVLVPVSGTAAIG